MWILSYYVHPRVVPFFASSSCMGCVLIPSLCHEPTGGPCRLLKCIHRAPCCPNVVSKKGTISRAPIFIKYICVIYISSCCRNLPFTGSATQGSRVRLPRKENARSRHQRLFEENVGKTGKVWSTNFECERFGSCIYAQGRY